MFDLPGVVRRHKLTAGMAVFLAAFYGVLMGAAMLSKGQEPVGDGPVPAEHRMTSEDLKKKEERFRIALMARPELAASIGFGLCAIVMGGLGIDAYLVSRRLRRRPFLDPETIHEAPPWGAPELIQMFVFLFFCEAVVLSVEIWAGLGAKLGPTGRDFFLMLNSLVRDVLVALFVLWMVRFRFKRPLSEIGLTTANFWRNVGLGLTGYVAMIPPLLVVLVALSVIAQQTKYEPPPQPVVEIYLRESKESSLVLFTVFVAVIGPMIEEIFFRGFTYKALRARFGVKWGIAGTALIFAAMHTSVIAFIPIFLLGAFLAYLYERTGSLVPGISAHVAHNLIMVLFTLAFKQLSG